MNNKKGILVFFIIAILIISIILIVEYIRANEEEAEVNINIPTVVTQKAIKDEFALYYKSKGKLVNNSYKIGADIIRNKVDKIYVKIGDVIKAGDSILSMDMTSSLSQLNLQIISSEESIKNVDLSIDQLKSKIEELKELFKAGLVSKNQLDELDNNLKQLESKKIGLIKNNSALIKEKNEISKLGIIYSKEDGIVDKIKLKENQYATRNDFIEIKKIGNNEARIYLTEKIVKKVEIGEPVDVMIDDEIYPGVIKEIYSLNPGDILYPVDIIINAETDFIPGISVQVKIPIYHNKEAILVNRKAVIQFNDEVYLYKVVNNKAIKTNIQIGNTSNSMTEVIKGISINDEIIVEGQFNIVNNEKVEVINK